MIKFKKSTNETFKDLKAMYAAKPRRWKIITWAVISIQVFSIVLNSVVGDWEWALTSFLFGAMFGICSLYSMTTSALIRVINEQESRIKAQNDMITLMVGVTRGK